MEKARAITSTTKTKLHEVMVAGPLGGLLAASFLALFPPHGVSFVAVVVFVVVVFVVVVFVAVAALAGVGVVFVTVVVGIRVVPTTIAPMVGANVGGAVFPEEFPMVKYRGVVVGCSVAVVFVVVVMVLGKPHPYSTMADAKMSHTMYV